MPFGELSHGGKGVLEYYTQLFNASSDVIAIELLKILAENNYRGHYDCPCGNGKRIRNCHGGLLRNINSYQTQMEFLYDYIQCLTYLQKVGKELPKSLFSETLMNYINKHSQGLNKNEKSGVNAIRIK